MEKKLAHAWVIDDDKNQRISTALMLEAQPIIIHDVEYNFQNIEKFSTVDEALKKFETLKPEEYPDLIYTDGDTESKFSGIDLAERVQKTGVGVLINSSLSDVEEQLRIRGCISAKFMDKLHFDFGQFYELVAAAIIAAKVEKRLAGKQSGQFEPYAGGRY